MAYRVFASMLKQRFLDAGLDDRIWPTQFGFRAKRCTEDAIFIARRRIELARAQKGGSVSLLALDWRKAFDSVNVDSMLSALQRKGITGKYIRLLRYIMNGRQFFVEDMGFTSERRPQRSGISQGCTLSPLLFITVMSCMMEDAVALLSPGASAAYISGNLADIAYADDTLVVGTATAHVQEFVQAISKAGQAYGLELHVKKFQLLQTGRQAEVQIGDRCVQCEESLVYLGSTLTADGKMATELSRRIGLASAEFRAVRQVWRHSVLSRRWRLHVFSALIESKLLYGLSAGCCLKADLRRLDGFQAKCLRVIMGISPSYISRISNAEVLQRAGVQSASDQLYRRQLVYMGKIMRSPPESALRRASFIPGTDVPATDRYERRRGRPNKEWIRTVMPQAIQLTGSYVRFREQVAQEHTWKQLVYNK